MLKKLLNNKNITIIFFLIWFLIFISLSLLRDSISDENIYLGNSVEIANIIQRGEWIGNYGIGLHGFLNKLLLGIVFIFTGPSVFIATLLNIIVSILSGILFYKILLKHFKFSQMYSLLGVILLFCSYQFLMYTPTFFRDIPALFFLLLVVYSILDKKSKWVTGIFLLLLLDSKEHVFYTVAPAFVIWIGMESFIQNRRNFRYWLKDFIINNIKLFLPSLVFLILMFTTSVIPINMYNASILGLVDGGLESMSSNFELDVATYNRDIAVNNDTARVMPMTMLSPEQPKFLTSISSYINIFLSYLGKILYPRTFSFLSIPFVVLIPSIWITLKMGIEWFRKKETSKLILPLMLSFYLLIYILHASISRYILPISPVIFIFYLIFLKELSSKKLHTKKLLLLTILFILGGLYFEYSYIYVKVLFNLIIVGLYLFIYLSKKKNKSFLKIGVVLLLSIFFAGTSLLASYSFHQIKGYMLYGYNRECEKIVSLVKREDRILINDIYWDKLPFILREENLGQAEWRWSLKEWIPKKKLLKENTGSKTFDFYWPNEEFLKTNIRENKINKIVYIKLHKFSEKENLLLQDRLEILLESNWLKLDKQVEMKNKTVYIFNVLN